LAAPHGVSHLEWANILRASGKFSNYPLPKVQKNPVIFAPEVDSSKAQRELGMEFIPLDQSLIEMSESLIDFGVVEKR